MNPQVCAIVFQSPAATAKASSGGGDKMVRSEPSRVRAVYDLGGLVSRLKELEPEFREVENRAKSTHQAASRRGYRLNGDERRKFFGKTEPRAHTRGRGGSGVHDMNMTDKRGYVNTYSESRRCPSS